MLKKSATSEEYAERYAIYAQMVTDVFCLCLGTENTEKIIRHFEENYIEMSVSLIPFIYDRVLPCVDESLRNQKDRLKNAYRKKRK